jgi:hypothetical protein
MSLRARISLALIDVPMLDSSVAHRGTLLLLLALTACGHDSSSATSSRDAAPEDSSAPADVATLDVAVDATDGGCIPYDASNLDPAAIVAGQMLSITLKCAKCHDDGLTGDPAGVMSPQTEGGLAYPPNLTPDPTTGLGCWTNAQITTAILDGIDNQGQPLCPPMPHFAEAGIDASGADDLVTFLRSITPAIATVPDTPSCTLGPVDAGSPDATDAAVDAASDAPTDG